MDRLKKYLKYKFKRFIVKYKLFECHLLKENFEYTGYERICSAIVRKTINHVDTKYTIAPLSNKRYLINKTLDIFIIMEDSKVEITNHVYHYVITLPKKEMIKLINRFDKKVDEERIMYENQIKSQIDYTLHKIYDKINFFN
jgi:hypothetical protein